MACLINEGQAIFGSAYCKSNQKPVPWIAKKVFNLTWLKLSWATHSNWYVFSRCKLIVRFAKKKGLDLGDPVKWAAQNKKISWASIPTGMVYLDSENCKLVVWICMCACFLREKGRNVLWCVKVQRWFLSLRNRPKRR